MVYYIPLLKFIAYQNNWINRLFFCRQRTRKGRGQKGQGTKDEVSSLVGVDKIEIKSWLNKKDKKAQEYLM